MATCTACGTSLAATARFCTQCGTPVERAVQLPVTPLPPAPPVAQPLPPAPPQEQAPPSHDHGAPEAAQSNRELWLIFGSIGCLSLILLASCLGLVWLFLSVENTRTILQQQATALPSALPTPLLPTATPELLRGPLGSVLLRDDFASSQRSSLGFGSDATSSYRFTDGAYQIEVNEPEFMVWSRATGRYADVTIEVTATLSAGPTATASGIIFRYQNDANFYLFSVANDGFYGLALLKDDTWQTLIDWTPSTAIASPGQPNQLRIETEGERITLFVNGVKLEETSDSTFQQGEVALAVNTFDEGNATILFDDLLITSLGE